MSSRWGQRLPAMREAPTCNPQDDSLPVLPVKVPLEYRIHICYRVSSLSDRAKLLRSRALGPPSRPPGEASAPSPQHPLVTNPLSASTHRVYSR